MKGLRIYHVILSISIVLFSYISSNSQSELGEIGDLITRWNNSHNIKDFDEFNVLYDDKLIFYAQELNREKCVRKKESLLKASPDFRQEIVGKVIVKSYDSGIFKCEFIKEVSSKGKEIRYPSYLLLRKISGKFYICGESDEITDKNLKYRLSLGNEIGIQKVDPVSSQSSGLLKYIAFSIIAVLSIFLVFRSFSRKVKMANEPIQSNERTIIQEEKLSSKETFTTEGEELAIKKGKEFEEFVVSKFDTKYFRLIDWRGDKGSNGVYAESNGYPDLLYSFNHKSYENKFAVECKFRQSYSAKGTVTIAQGYQINKYREFGIQNNVKVYIVLGVGGQPIEPSELFIIPLDAVVKTEMHETELKVFLRSSTNNFFFKTDLGLLT